MASTTDPVEARHFIQGIRIVRDKAVLARDKEVAQRCRSGCDRGTRSLQTGERLAIFEDDDAPSLVHHRHPAITTTGGSGTSMMVILLFVVFTMMIMSSSIGRSTSP